LRRLSWTTGPLQARFCKGEGELRLLQREVAVDASPLTKQKERNTRREEQEQAQKLVFFF
jgi:hypothetical protein